MHKGLTLGLVLLFLLFHRLLFKKTRTNTTLAQKKRLTKNDMNPESFYNFRGSYQIRNYSFNNSLSIFFLRTSSYALRNMSLVWL